MFTIAILALGAAGIFAANKKGKRRVPKTYTAVPGTPIIPTTPPARQISDGSSQPECAPGFVMINGKCQASSVAKTPATGRPFLESSIPGNTPVVGYASGLTFTWGWIVGAGESAGSIAASIVGDDGRYQELMLSNSTIPTQGSAGTYLGSDAWNFAEGSLKEGMKLNIPLPWMDWIDEMGNRRGMKDAFPSRPVTSSAISERTEAENLAYTKAFNDGKLAAGEGFEYNEALSGCSRSDSPDACKLGYLDGFNSGK